MDNNDIVDRIIELRTNLGYKQYEMSEKLGLKQGSLSDIERRKTKKVTDQLIMLLCHKFNVNEEWLRHGTGEMFIKIDNSLLFNLSNQYNLNDTDLKIISNYISLAPEQRKIFNSVFQL